jgi:hypothetical protein
MATGNTIQSTHKYSFKSKGNGDATVSAISVAGAASSVVRFGRCTLIL